MQIRQSLLGKLNNLLPTWGSNPNSGASIQRVLIGENAQKGTRQWYCEFGSIGLRGRGGGD